MGDEAGRRALQDGVQEGVQEGVRGTARGARAYQRHVDTPLADEERPRLRSQVARGGPYVARAGAAGQPEQEERPAVEGRVRAGVGGRVRVAVGVR